MELFNSLATVSFYGILTGILVVAMLCVMTPNLFHAAIYLAFTMLGVAIVFFFLQADFLGAVQILIYVGAVMTLVIFAIMLTVRIGDPAVPQTNRQSFPALIVLVLLGAGLIRVLVNAPWKLAANAQTASAVQIGQTLMGEYVLPFEVISLVLLAALIGTIAIARND